MEGVSHSQHESKTITLDQAVMFLNAIQFDRSGNLDTTNKYTQVALSLLKECPQDVLLAAAAEEDVNYDASKVEQIIAAIK